MMRRVYDERNTQKLQFIDESVWWHGFISKREGTTGEGATNEPDI